MSSLSFGICTSQYFCCVQLRQVCFYSLFVSGALSHAHVTTLWCNERQNERPQSLQSLSAKEHTGCAEVCIYAILGFQGLADLINVCLHSTSSLLIAECSPKEQMPACVSLIQCPSALQMLCPPRKDIQATMDHSWNRSASILT